jgi:hypothetical protein
MLDQDSAPPDTPAADPAGAEASGVRLNGVVDVSRSGRVVGWAIDRSDPKAAVDVEIYRDGKRLATVKADRHREDLVRNGIGTGNYGFLVELDPPIDPGMTFAVTAMARAADGTRNALRPVGKAAPSADPQHRILERTFEEIISLRADVARLRSEVPGTDEDAMERLRTMLERIEVIQSRVEASTLAASPEVTRGTDTGLRAIAGIALLTAVGSLALGIFSMWFP